MLFEERLKVPKEAGGEASSALVEGVLHGDGDSWIILTRDGMELADWLGADEEGEDPRLTVCRQVRDDGTVVLGGAVPVHPCRAAAPAEFE
jgi:hypothetical protein